jgi:hypothetical protein
MPKEGQTDSSNVTVPLYAGPSRAHPIRSLDEYENVYCFYLGEPAFSLTVGITEQLIMR